jgi:hypothetical protein
VERLERVFDVLGWIGLLLLVPLGFYVFNYSPAVDFLQRLGAVGRPTTITLAAFVLIALRILFGGGQLAAPMLISFVVGFFLMAGVVTFRFMSWYAQFAGKVMFLDSRTLNFLAACFVLLFGTLLSYARRVSIWVQLILLLVVPVVFLLVAGAFGGFHFPVPAL